jgi:eukaryotic-like serine/threonine-protein kinase
VDGARPRTGAGARVVAGRYRLLGELGRGGMGVVWQAEDQLVSRQVAVKELRPPPGLPDDEREVHARRALAEARSVARVRHPGAVTLFDVLPATADDGAVYLIMELISGPALDEVIRRDGPLPDATVAAYGRQLLAVLEVAHNLGSVHRDPQL